ncbi:sodium:proton antiporter [Arsenicitalea aurantiaca]|uniref:Sodium:proton antiporter n=1 Tax=Arsenicitalea aurantiaca TaxID=1783274 RepID=A0A433X2R3_9HYPH|nr:Na+/H+ antiporter subunit E [Arsenicitalea aurantiaca]RUT28350.1 sodium:proton antiporter [Arsenicitalea aurantiaca]
MSDRIPLHRRIWAALVLAVIFIYELVISSITVAKTVLAREPQLAPAIIAVPIALKTDLGIATVANMVSLTPGTTSLHVSEDRKILYVHALDAPSRDAAVEAIKTTFERRVKEVEG